MSKPRKRHEEHEEHENHERWLITYADMITLLMAFFIMLFAMSQIDLAKFAAFRSGLAGKLGVKPDPVLDGGTGLLGKGTGINDGGSDADAAKLALLEKQQHDSAVRQERDTLNKAQQVITSALTPLGLAQEVHFRLEDRGLIVTIVSDRVLFDLGSADLRPEGRAILDGMSGALAQLPNDTSIEGHTDDLPISGGPFPSNWELSTARATTVLRHLASDGVPEPRMSAAGYSSTQPLVPDSDPTALSVNRRVDIVVLSPASAEANALLPGLDAAAHEGATK